MAESKAAIAALRSLVATGELAAPTTGPEARALVEAAQAQGLSGILLRTIEGGPAAAWAEADVAALKVERRRTLVRTLGQIELCRRVIDILDAQGIRALPLKGAALAGTVYDVESDRPMSDVDVLALDAWGDGIGLLRDRGFVEIARGDHAWALRDPGSGEIVELHRSVTSCPGLFPLRVDALWGRSRPGSGQLLRLPSPEDLMLQLALHASFQHGFVLPLFQWLDFRRLLERETIDTARLLSAAAESRAEAPLAASLLVAEAVVGTPVPAALRRALDAHVGSGLRRWLEARRPAPLAFVPPEGEPDHVRVRWMLVPQMTRRVHLVWRTLVVPDGPGETSFRQQLAEGARRAFRFAALVGSRRGKGGGAGDEPGPEADMPSRSGADPEPTRGHTDGPLDRPPATRPGDARRSHDAGEACGGRDVVAGPAGNGGPGELDRDRLLRECLASFPWVRLTVTGSCMQPSIDHGEKVHLVSAERRAPRMGDVVLACGAHGLVLHRLVWGPPLAPPGIRWRTKADRGLLLDPPLAPADVLATVVAVERRLTPRPRRPALALVSLGRAIVARLRLGLRAPGVASAA